MPSIPYDFESWQRVAHDRVQAGRWTRDISIWLDRARRFDDAAESGHGRGVIGDRLAEPAGMAAMVTIPPGRG